MKIKETTGQCPSCSARWSRLGGGWLVTDIHGRLTLAEGSAAPQCCPVCQALAIAGKATVREERG